MNILMNILILMKKFRMMNKYEDFFKKNKFQNSTISLILFECCQLLLDKLDSLIVHQIFKINKIQFVDISIIFKKRFS